MNFSLNNKTDSKTVAIALAICAVVLPYFSGCQTFNRSSMKNAEGVAYYSMGQYDQALPYFQEAIQLDANNAEPYYNIASTYQQQAAAYNQPSLLVQAENYYRACLDRNPTPETTVYCYRGLATSMSQQNRGDQALELLRSWELRNQSSIEPKLEVAYLLEAMNRNTEALKTLKDAVALAPGDYRLHYKMGILEEKAGSPVEALNQYLMAGRLSPADTEIAQRIAVLQGNPNVQRLQAEALAAGGRGSVTVGGQTDSPSTTEVKNTSQSTTVQFDGAEVPAPVPPLPTISIEPPNFNLLEPPVSVNPAPLPSLESATPGTVSYVQPTASVSNTPAGTGESVPTVPIIPTTPNLDTPGYGTSLPDGTGATSGTNIIAVPQASFLVPATSPVPEPPSNISTPPAPSTPHPLPTGTTAPRNNRSRIGQMGNYSSSQRAGAGL